MAESPVGTTAKVTILRNGKKEELTVTVRSAEASGQVLMAAIKERLGVEVRAPHKAEIDKYNLNPNQGVVITWLDRKGPMKGAGFELRDMILAIDEQQVDSVEGFIGLVNALKPKQKVTILALDHRTGNTDTIELITK